MDINHKLKMSEVKAAMSLLDEAAKTVNRDGGDEWLARQLRREFCKMGDSALESLYDDHRYVEFAELSLVVARGYVTCKDYIAASLVLADADAILCDYENADDPESSSNELLREVENLLEMVKYRIDRAGAEFKRRLKRERKMKWRNSKTKKLLRRVYDDRVGLGLRVSRDIRWHEMHERINEDTARRRYERRHNNQTARRDAGARLPNDSQG